MLAFAARSRDCSLKSIARALQVVLPVPLTDAEVEDVHKVRPFVPGIMQTHARTYLHIVLTCGKV